MRVHRICSAVPFDSNIYLVVSDRTMLVDTGSGLDGEGVSAGIRRVLGDRDLDMIVLTHCHYDHAGGLAGLMEEFGCPAYAGSPDAEYVSDGDPVHTLSSMFEGSMEKVQVSSLSDGDIIDLGSQSFTVIATPGHTEGGICLYDSENGVLFSGDTLFEIGVGRTDFVGGSPDDLRRSLLRLSNIDIREMYPGHGSMCQNYSPVMMARALSLVGM